MDYFWWKNYEEEHDNHFYRSEYVWTLPLEKIDGIKSTHIIVKGLQIEIRNIITQITIYEVWNVSWNSFVIMKCACNLQDTFTYVNWVYEIINQKISKMLYPWLHPAPQTH
jgi:hypothetical protein